MVSHTILIVDDEKIQRESLAGFLKKQNYVVYSAGSARSALQIINEHPVDIVFSDVKMEGLSGYDLLKEIKRINPQITVIIMTAFGKIEEAVQAMKDGAFDYLTKPIDLNEVELIIGRAIELKHLTRENEELKERLREKHRLQNILTNSPLMEKMLSMAARASRTKAAVLIQGESGTGKELIANAIHQSSPFADKAMITVNCAAIPENLFESELFGHEKGSFTGAIQQKAGLVEVADNSTLFLDEVGDIPLPMQVKLLRFLQFGEFQRVGGNTLRKVSVRIIAATNRDLQRMIAEKKFREDFYYRLNVVNIHIPPLRMRKEDIPLLIDFFIKKYGHENQKKITKISKEALDMLMKYDYPGNIRELENIIQRAVVLARDEIIIRSDLPVHIHSSAFSTDTSATHPGQYYTGTFREKVAAFEKDLIKQALAEHHFNQSRAAASLGINERNLRYKMQKYGIIAPK